MRLMGWLLLVVGVAVGVFLSGCVRVGEVHAQAGGVDVREAMRCGVGKSAEMTMRGEYGRCCGWCGDDVEMVVRVHGDRHDMNPHKGQSRGVVVRWHQRDPESNSRRCAEIQNDSSSLGSTPSVVDVHVRNSGSSDESISKSTSGSKKRNCAGVSGPVFNSPFHATSIAVDPGERLLLRCPRPKLPSRRPRFPPGPPARPFLRFRTRPCRVLIRQNTVASRARFLPITTLTVTSPPSM